MSCGGLVVDQERPGPSTKILGNFEIELGLGSPGKLKRTPSEPIWAIFTFEPTANFLGKSKVCIYTEGP